MGHTSTGFGIFANTSGNKTFFSDDAMRAKWSFVLEYVKSCREKLGLDVSQYNLLIEKGYIEADAATVNLEMIAFICEKECNYASGNVSYSTTDYSKNEYKNGIWQFIHNDLITKKTFNKGINALSVLPLAIKSGVTFEGWYTSKDLTSSSKVTSSTVLNASVSLYPKFLTTAGINAKVTFDYNGGVSDTLYQKYGTKLSSLTISSYNGNFWEGTNYASNIFVSDSNNDPKAKFSTRLYIKKNGNTNFYTIINILQSGTVSTWAEGADYVITISGQYSGTYDDNFTLSKISIGDIAIFDKTVTSISSSNKSVVNIYSPTLSNDTITETITSSSVLPIPSRVGYSFDGWYDSYNKKYDTVSDFNGIASITLYANWIFEDKLIGEFEGNSWIVKGGNIQLLTTYLSGNTSSLTWKSEHPNIATVSQNGTVKGVSEGVATIIVCDSEYPSISFTFYVTVFNEDPTGIVGLLVDSNNSSIYTKDGLLIGITYGSDGAYYADIVGSVSKLLFEGYTVHKDYYLSNPSNKSTLVGVGKGGIDYITLHYAADMPYSASASLTGGKNLASYNKSCNTNGTSASWHYSTGNDGVWYCQNTAYGAWHAGSSKSMTWHATGVTTSKVGTDIYTPDVTLGSDGYFYLKGVKTSVKNTTSGTKLNGMGLGVKLVGNEWYISGHYYNTSYKYISATGGNNNSIGIESSVRQGSDLWLTWQYSAQLCAQLLIEFELPLNRLVGHHFFSGKWCPQPMLENDLEIWYEFVDMVRSQKIYYESYSSYSLDFTSNSTYLKDNGRIKNLPTYSECITYTVNYTINGVTKSVTLSSILPGSIA